MPTLNKSPQLRTQFLGYLRSCFARFECIHLAIACLCVLAADGQQRAASIHDTVADPSGAVIADATVPVTGTTARPWVRSNGDFKLAVSSAQSSSVDKQHPTQTDLKLKFAVIVTRHGVRSPIRRVEELEAYSDAPWPDWGVAPGDLTPNGRKLMVMFGSYYRDYFVHNRLLSTSGCGDANTIHIRADVDSRTQDTGRALASGMMPRCSIDVHVLRGEKDPLFSPLAARIGTPDRALAVASIAGRIGGNPDAVVANHRQAFDTLREVLFGCVPNVPCAAEEQRGKKAILREPSSIGATEHGHMADIYGPLKIGSNLSESLQLEYANGMTGERLGWGRLTTAKLMDIMTLHAAYADLVRQTPYIARIQASNLLSHIVSSMQQTVDNAPAKGSLGKVGDRVLVIVGHDTNLSNIAGTLGISWLLNGYQRDDTPPGGALVFELWQDRNREFTVRTYFTAQSLEKMHSVISISLQSPPLKSPIFIPGCSGSDQYMSCPWKGFQRTVESALDPEFVKL
jgi:4-phytase/acid phosphatase